MTKQKVTAADADLIAERVHSLVREVMDQGPLHQRTFLPMSSDVLIQPSQCAQITGRPQVPFRGDRLAVWSGSAAHFMIDGIRAGNSYVDAQAGSVPADAFATRLDLLPVLDKQLEKDGLIEIRISKMAEECFGQLIAMPLVRPGTDLTLTITNISDKPQMWRACFLGDRC